MTTHSLQRLDWQDRRLKISLLWHLISGSETHSTQTTRRHRVENVDPCLPRQILSIRVKNVHPCLSRQIFVDSCQKRRSVFVASNFCQFVCKNVDPCLPRLILSICVKNVYPCLPRQNFVDPCLPRQNFCRSVRVKTSIHVCRFKFCLIEMILTFLKLAD